MPSTWSAIIELFDTAPLQKIRRPAMPASDFISWPYLQKQPGFSAGTNKNRDNWQKEIIKGAPTQWLFYYSASKDKFLPFTPSDLDRAATDWDPMA